MRQRISHPESGRGLGCEAKIRELAYAKWVDAGCPPCDGVEFWLAAEEELASRDLQREYATPASESIRTPLPPARVLGGRAAVAR